MVISAFVLLVAAQAAAAAPSANVPAPRTVVPVAPPAAGERISARARTNLASYVSTDDYPDEAMFNDEEGTTGFRLNIATDGSVSECKVISSSGSPSLDDATCAIMRSRARFSPARAADGSPITDTVVARVTWRIAQDSRAAFRGARPFPVHRAWAITALASLVQPADRPQASFNGTTRFEVGIGPDGSVTDCTVRASSGSAPLDEAACRIVRERGRFAPGRDESGRMVPDILRGHIGWAAPTPLAASISADLEASARTWLAGQGIELRELEVSPDETVTATMVDRTGTAFRGVCRMVAQAAPFPERLTCHEAVDARTIANMEPRVRQWLSGYGTVRQLTLRRLDDDRMRGEARVRDPDGREKNVTCVVVRSEFGSDNFNWDCQ